MSVERAESTAPVSQPETFHLLAPAEQGSYDESARLLETSISFKDPICEDAKGFTYKDVWQEMGLQGKLSLPLAANLLLISARQIITLSFVSRFGTTELAASALAQGTTFMFGSLPLIGLACALDTLASQAFGAGQISSLAAIFQRTIAFLATHCVGLTLLLLCLPRILEATGEDPEICSRMAAFSHGLLLGVWLDVINRPMNRILVAQKITKPQAVVSTVATLLHFLINYAFINVMKLGPVSVAWANSFSNLCQLILMLAYVALYNKGYCIWGNGISLQAFRDWKPYARIAYPACFMDCAESWCWGLMNILAGLLPNPAKQVSALGIAFSLFNATYFIYLSQGLSCSTRVGNSLGAGDAVQANIAMWAASSWVPITWAFSAVLFSEPHIRELLAWMYTDGQDLELLRHLNHLLWLMIILNFSDGLQCVLSGVLQGLGRQLVGLKVNLVAFYVVAVPSAAFFGFTLKWGVEGLYCGIILGATVQALGYIKHLRKVDWTYEALAAAVRVQEVTKSADKATVP